MASVFFSMNGTESSVESERGGEGLSRAEKSRN